MDEASIRKYAQLMQELDLTGLEVTEGDRTVRLERGGGSAAAPASPATAPAAAQAAAEEKGFPVSSPMVGVFYVAPAQDAAPFVNVGDRVRRGDVLCIIESMKIMNEITAERDGTVTEICAADGQTVEYGTVLFRMEG